MQPHPDKESKELRVVLLGFRGAGEDLVRKQPPGRGVVRPGEDRLLRLAATGRRGGEEPPNGGRHPRGVEGRHPSTTRLSSSNKSWSAAPRVVPPPPPPAPPHRRAFLLVAPSDVPFLEEHRVSVREHMALLGVRVWSHTMVVFTRGDRRSGVLEEYIEQEGAALQWVLGKCDRRYGVLDNKKKTAFWGTPGNRSRLSKIRLVLLGHRTAGKSASADSILGLDEGATPAAGRTTRCRARRARHLGREITVVDTPGWWANASVEDTGELVKEEMLSGLASCPPGPHALLLVVRADVAFPERFGRSVPEHMSLMGGEDAWEHTVVLFTRGDYLGEDGGGERFIESEGGGPLQEIVQRCHHRYHLFDNRNRGDVGQVEALLEKVEEMVAVNGGRCYEKAQVYRGMRKQIRASGTFWRNRVRKRSRAPRLEELTVLLLGHRGSGKSSSGNTLLGAGGGAERFRPGTLRTNVQRRGHVEGRRVTSIDTPGWRMCRPPGEADHPAEEAAVRRGLAEGLSLGPHCILVCLRADVTHGDDSCRAAERHLLPLLDGRWNRTLVLVTHGECLAGRAAEQYIQGAGRGLRALLEKCSNRYHVLCNKSEDVTQVRELLLKIEEVLAGNWLEKRQ